MQYFGPLFGPALALFIIVRRGLKPRRVKTGRLWTYPVLITLLAVSSLTQRSAPNLLSLALFAGAAIVGAAVGWFTTQHLELTLDPESGTITSKPTLWGTALTAAVFMAKFGVNYLTGNQPGMPPGAIIPAEHHDTLLRLSDAGLLFVVGRSLAQTAHMWLRIRPMLADHEARKATAPVSPTPPVP